ncbi:MAG: ATP-binding protein [Methanomicrobiales archaeon]|nr:ATP-binding protein [Methanomicrobiales archaeon]
MSEKCITVRADLADLDEVITFVEEVLNGEGVPERIVFDVALATDEAVTNVMNYAYPAGDGSLTVTCELRDAVITISVRDNGSPFNPLATPLPDITSNLEDRQVGGLGVHLIRQLMNEVAYRRDGDENILSMRKQIPIAVIDPPPLN